MKNLIYLLMFALFYSSCSSGNQSDATVIEDVSDAVTEIETTNADPDPEPSTQPSTYYEYEGEIEGGIPFKLKFHQLNDLIKGELIYKKVGKPITILGTINEDGFYDISEFGKDGMITGILSGKFASDAKDLTWFSPESRKNLKMELKLKTKKESDFDFSHENIIGKYRYEFGKDGAAGYLDVSKLTKDSIYLDLLCVTHAPGRNIASMEGAVMAIDENKASVDFKEDDFYDCAYDILFYEDFARVKYIDNRVNCGFGHNAYVEGFFVKVED